jgi:type 1 glutamine amidotransferase
MNLLNRLLLALLAGFLWPAVVHGAEVKPLRALLVTGGCCHDYATQKETLKQGLEARANVVVTQVHTDDKSTKPPLPILGNADYAKDFDVVIHDECAADISDPALIQAVLAPHRAGVPGVNLHCAMHSYRIGNPNEPAAAGSERARWFEYLGLQSSGHGPQLPIGIAFVKQPHPILRGLRDWITVNEELYNNVQVLPAAKPLAYGTQFVVNAAGVAREDKAVVVWVHEFHGARVFSTTLGHNNETVADSRYLDLVARGLLWACGKLDDRGEIAAGYRPRK